MRTSMIDPALKSMIFTVLDSDAEKKRQKERDEFHRRQQWTMKAQTFINNNAHTVFVNRITGATVVLPNYRIVSTFEGRAVQWHPPSCFDAARLLDYSHSFNMTAIHLLEGGKKRAEAIAKAIKAHWHNALVIDEFIKETVRLIK